MRNSLVLLILCLLLSGCDAASGASAQSPEEGERQLPTETVLQENTAADPASQAYYDGLSREREDIRVYETLLNGSRKFTDVPTGNSLSIESMLWHYASGETPSVRCLTMVDVNQDGMLELIVWMRTSTDDRYGFVLLSYAGGEVYGNRMDGSYFRELKIDGSFLLDQEGYVRLTDPSGQQPPEAFSRNAQEHSSKPDVIWYDQWMDMLYSSTAAASAGSLDETAVLTDPARQQELPLEEAGQLLLPQEVQTHIVQCTALDLDGDGVQETVLQIGTESDDHVGFVVLRQEQGQYIGQGYYYRSFFRLRTDGSYTFSSGTSASGYGRLTFRDGVWGETVLAQTYETTQTDGNVYRIYLVGGEMTTEEDYNRFVVKQEAKELQTWYPSLSDIQ